MLSEDQTITDPLEPKTLPQGAIGIDFDGVSFAYASRSDQPVLYDINLNIRPTERIALVGPSGAGKSTLINLILRLNDPSQGAVMIGGVDALDAAIADLRGAMGLVPQETALFSGTIASNIAFGRPDASMEMIRNAAIKANADEFIKTMPQGYDTPVGEKASGFQAGKDSGLPSPVLFFVIRKSCFWMKRLHPWTRNLNKRCNPPLKI